MSFYYKIEQITVYLCYLSHYVKFWELQSRNILYSSGGPFLQFILRTSAYIPWRGSLIRERSSLIKLPDGATVTELRADLQDVITLPVIQNSEKRLNIQQQIWYHQKHNRLYICINRCLKTNEKLFVRNHQSKSKVTGKSPKTIRQI